MPAAILSNNPFFRLKTMRKRGQTALYEVLGKARINSCPNNASLKAVAAVEKIQAQAAVVVEKPAAKPVQMPLFEKPIEKPMPVVQPIQVPTAVEKPIIAKAAVEKTAAPTAKNLSRWPKKPRIWQLNNGRIEFSIPYQLIIAVSLGIVLLPLMAFRLGQLNSGPSEGKAVVNGKNAASAGNLFGIGNEPEKKVVEQPKVEIGPVAEVKTEIPQVKAAANSGTGVNRIVILQCDNQRDIEPVKKFFKDNGIETEIRSAGSGSYMLVSAGKYENPAKAGTDGFEARKKIVEVGAKYEAPAGYGSFGTKPFQDAYGMKFND